MAEGGGSGDANGTLVRRLRRWRAAAILAGAVAVSLSALLLADALRNIPPAQHWAGVLQAQSAAPAIGLSLDLQSRSLTVRPAAPPPEGQIYELWLLTGEPPSATALGRVRGEAVLQPDALRRLTRAQLRNATFAVSLAPADSAPPSRRPATSCCAANFSPSEPDATPVQFARIGTCGAAVRGNSPARRGSSAISTERA